MSDFDEEDFDVEDDGQKIDLSQLLPQSGKQDAYKCLSMTAPRFYSQDTFDYQKQMAQILIREQTTNSAAQYTDSMTQCYAEDVELEKNVQIPQISGSALQLLLKINEVEIQQSKTIDAELLRSHVRQTLHHMAGQEAQFDFEITKTQQSIVLVKMTRATPRSEKYVAEVPKVGSESVQLPLNVFEQDQNLLFIDLQDLGMQVLRHFKPVDFEIIGDQLFILQESGRIVQISMSTIDVVGESEDYQLKQMASNQQVIIGASEANLIQFSNIRQVELIAKQVDFVVGICNRFAVVCNDEAQVVDGIHDIKKTGDKMRLTEKITSALKFKDKISVKYVSGRTELWGIKGNSLQVVCE